MTSTKIQEREGQKNPELSIECMDVYLSMIHEFGIGYHNLRCSACKFEVFTFFQVQASLQ
jgi:hypothetical protein